MAYTTIDKPSDYFNTILYTGDGTSSRSITGVGFQPDWVWFKKRSTTGSHNLADSVRGTTKVLLSNQTLAEITDATTLTSFDSDGFSIGTGWNASSTTMVTWNWLAGGTASSNTDGSITSSVSANTTAGFSIVSYTGNGSAGATVGHGLGATPAMFLIKRRDVADGWIVYHHKNTSAPETDHLRLDNTSATSDDNTKFNDTAPTSSVFSLGSDTSVNGSSSTFIVYCFAEKKGYSKFGSYIGNGSSDGSFIFTGFKPAWVLLKATSIGTEHWWIYDNKRSESNVTDDGIVASLSNAEFSNNATFKIDLLSNGFKLRNSDGSHNGSGTSYIYMAFAENPFVTSSGVPACAR